MLLASVLFIAAPAPDASAGWKSPTGWDVYSRLDTLSRLRDSTRTVQVSSYDRTGGNDDGVNGTYSCPRRVPAGCVIAERRGAGQIESIWFTRDFGNLAATGTISVYLDGRRVIDGPLVDVLNGALGPPFVFPLVASSAQSSGGGYIRVPLPFRRSMRVVTGMNPDYYHVIYRTFPGDHAVPAFKRLRRVPRAVRTAGHADPKPPQRTRTRQRAFTLRRVSTTRLLRLRGSGSIAGLALRLRGLDRLGPFISADILRRTRLRMRFDGHLAVDAPLGEFFGSGWAPATVRSLMFRMGPRATDWMRSWWPMPYGRSVSIALVNPTGIDVPDGLLRVDAARSPRWRNRLRSGVDGYFHATARGPSPTTRGEDWSFLRVRGRGTFVGVVQTMRANTTLYMEGDERVYVDGESRPSFHGTGTEDFYEGGWYFTSGFRTRPFTLPLNGFPSVIDRATGCSADDCRSMYRLMLADAVPFRRSLRFGIEHGPMNDVDAVYSSTAFWYQRRSR